MELALANLALGFNAAPVVNGLTRSTPIKHHHAGGQPTGPGYQTSGLSWYMLWLMLLSLAPLSTR